MRQSQVIDLPFPIKGLVEITSKRDQPALTTLAVQNMRAFSPTTGRARGSQRAGLLKYSTAQVNGTNRVQDLSQITSVSTAAAALSTLQIRSIKLLAVSNGTIRIVTPTASTAPATGANTLSATAPVIFSAPMFGVMYYTDGASAPVQYTSSTDTLAAWTASSGTFPISGSDYPRLIELWRGRIVLAGIKSDPHNWFMSAVGDARNYNYAPVPEVETQAVAGNASTLGKVGDVVMSIIPYNDDLLIFGCDHEIWQMTGDPASGGRLDRVSGITGMSWGRPWCLSPEGHVFFFGSRGGVYRMTPGESPVRITASSIDDRMSEINLDKNIVRLVWNDKEIGFHVFVTNLSGQSVENYFYDVRNEAWFVDKFGTQEHYPVATHVFDGDDPNDRAILLGSNDGYLRYLTDTSSSDDGTAIDSYVTLGPILVENGEVPFIVREVQSILRAGSSDVTYEVAIGNSLEDISFNSLGGGRILFENGDAILFEDGSGVLINELDTTDYLANSTGTFSPRRSVVRSPRRRGYGGYLRLSNDTLGESWEMENARAVVSAISSSKRRGN